MNLKIVMKSKQYSRVQNNMRILSIDPGFERLGIALIDKEKSGKEILVYSECFKTKKEDAFPIRLHQVGEKIQNIIQEYRPDILAIETLFLTTNQKTVMHVSEARGVIIYEAMRGNLVIYEYTPLQIKIAVTGYGRADKKQVMGMVPKIITLREKSASDDELDAIAVGLTCVAHEHI